MKKKLAMGIVLFLLTSCTNNSLSSNEVSQSNSKSDILESLPTESVLNEPIYEEITCSLLEDGTYELISINKEYLEEYQIPSTYKDIPITKISGVGSFDCAKLIIPDTVAILGEYAFAGMSRVREIVCSKNLKEIYIDLMYLCSNLESLILYEGIEIMSLGMTSLDTKVFNEFCGGYYLGNDENPYLYFMSKKSSDFSMNDNCKYLFGSLGKETFISKNIKKIYTNRFNQTEFTNILVDENNEYFTSIDGKLYSKDKKIFYAYASNKENDEFIFEEETEEIAAYAFHNTSKLNKISITENIKTIGEDAFYKCTNLSDIVIDNNDNFIIENKVLYTSDYETLIKSLDDSNVKILTLPEKTKTIVKHAFYENKYLENVKLSNVEYVGFEAFAYSKELSIIDFGEANLIIEEKAFTNCEKIGELNLSNNIKKVGTCCFKECFGLTKVIIDIDSKELESALFEDCYRLNYVEIKSSIEKLDGTFSACSVKTIKLPNSLKSLPGAFAYSGIEIIEIPEGVEIIDDYAFLFSGLKNTKLPSSLKEIGTGAFASTKSLEYIVIPSNVHTIKKDAFSESNKDLIIYFESTTLPANLEEGWLGENTTLKYYLGNEWEYDENQKPIIK